jgi:CBS domain-containing protein
LTATGTFDYNDLNAYLLVVLGLAHPTEDKVDSYSEIANKAQEGKPIPLGDVISLAKKAPLVTLTESQDLSQAIEYFSGGVHRLLVLKEGTSDVIGVFSQWKLVNFLWEYGGNFQVIDNLYPKTLRELEIGSHQIISVK